LAIYGSEQCVLQTGYADKKAAVWEMLAEETSKYSSDSS